MSENEEYPEIIEINLDDMFHSHPINTHIFARFLIARLEEHPTTTDRQIEYIVAARDVALSGTRNIHIRLKWASNLVPSVLLAAQNEYITEAASYGMALVILSQFTSAVLVDVADRGDGYDYVLFENGVKCGREVSGTQSENLQTLQDRHALKVRQLLNSPTNLGGYVAIVGFALREIVISYHGQENEMK